MNSIQTYLSTSYLMTPVSGTQLELFYLIVPTVIILAVIGFRIFLMIKGNRPKVFRDFDKLWFWGGFLFGLFGLFIYFSRTQSLPIFSTRTISYLWVLSLIAYSTFLIFNYRMSVPEKLHNYYEGKRKSKYLSR
jgi:drug/metabolite transporter (DMT)-like permease